jgi:ABC-type ATPase with predicted acetyltransferase domain
MSESKSDTFDEAREIHVDESYEIDPKENTFRTQKIKDAYGIDFDAGELKVIDDVSVEVSPGDIVFATGASGAGKTTFCEAIVDELDGIDFDEVDVPKDVPVVEIFPDEFDVDETQKYMGMFGLGDAHLNLRTYDELSQGQRYRAKLAYVASRHDVIFADEFCATLDRETAKTISYSIRRQTLKGRLDNTFVFATTHRDIIQDLRPDLLVDFDENAVQRLDAHNVALEGEDYEVVYPDEEHDGGDNPLSHSGRTNSTPTYRLVSQINSNLRQPPKKTGRISIGGIISGRT